MKIKTATLTDQALDWVVATLQGYANLRTDSDGALILDPPRKDYGPVYLYDQEFSTDWAQGGPIIEQEGIHLEWSESHEYWIACTWDRYSNPDYSCEVGDAALIAAMRCYVASRLGEKVDVPDELMKTT